MKKFIKFIMALPGGTLTFLIGICSAVAWLWHKACEMKTIYDIAQTSKRVPENRPVAVGESDSKGITQIETELGEIKDGPVGASPDLEVDISGDAELEPVQPIEDDGSTQALIDKLDKELQQ